MAYDPFERGNLPVGVRTFNWSDSSRGDRFLPVEVWYPAAEAHRGQDLAEATRDAYELIPGFPPGWQEAVRDAAARGGAYPLVVFSHGFGAHRRQSTFLCTHLASHGYVVAAMDHTGNTIFEMVQMMMAGQMGGPAPDPGAILSEIIPARPADASFVIDRMVAGVEGVPAIDADRIGMSGHSFGGWTTLMVAGRDSRVRAALPLAPAGGWTPLPSAPLQRALVLDWSREVPTLYLVADSDTILPLRGMHELYARTTSPKRMVVLENADHMHFCDQIEQIHELFRMMPPPIFDQVASAIKPIGELCAPDSAYRFVRGLGLAHMDAHVRGIEPAARFLGGDLAAMLRVLGVGAAVV
ncbi:MAG: dienelactone hydrolase family protein [Deltaproteobacteria bacterium]|nr:dienelactone hydrolase family protein [Deltaproteobacteria bacterium]